MKIISVVVPVYNEEENIEHFYKSIVEVFDKLDYEFELDFVDDGSKDRSREILRELEEKDSRVQSIFLAKNSGHQLALTCGLDHADGDAVIMMDGDMQHPPELIPILLAKWEEGYEVVQTIRKTTEGVSMFKKLTSAYYYKVLNALSTVHIQEGGSDFRLMDQVVVKAFRRYREHARFIRGMIGSMGFKQTQIEFVAPKRFAGVSKFSPKKMLHFAIDGVMAFSTLPLRMGLYIGVCCGFLSFLLFLHVLVSKYVFNDAVAGWATITACILFFGGVQLTVLGIMGEYISRIYEEVKNRPLYLIGRGRPKDEEKE
ncbi:glycosyltransferase family 2 protein [Anaerovibrio lipolyticus]|uniref:glycosyltransferase family 2 protein n=1 Tax=Anaerovibrio lipolyticus TaxID=82374 RepID=UPI0026EFF70D|nr:glycosyltransferase family 2 protein [Anaerovibrio lipolyticus]MBE6105809.1 glycosyltransferase family 2 protein [Anaerovibrio lipolyticus]